MSLEAIQAIIETIVGIIIVFMFIGIFVEASHDIKEDHKRRK